METLKETKKHSLTGRMAILVGIIFALSVVIICAFNFQITRNVMHDNMVSTVQHTVDYYETQVSNWLNLRIDQLNSIKSNIESMPSDQRNVETIENMLITSTNYGQDFGVISDYLIYPDKTMVCGDSWVPEEGYDATQTEYYQKAVEVNGIYITTPYIDATTGDFVVTISEPVMVNGKLYAVLARDLKITEIKEIANLYDGSDGSYLYLLDREGNILSHKNSAYRPTGDKIVNINDVSMTLLSDATNSSGDTLQAVDYDNQKKDFLAKVEQNSGWTIGVSYPNEIIRNRLAGQMLVNFIVFLVALVLSMIVLVGVLKKKIAPIQKVVNAAQKIENGCLNVEVNVRSNDEIGTLADTFHNTADYLQEIIGEISGILDQLSSGNLNIHMQSDYRGDFHQIHDSIENIIANLNEIISGIDQVANEVATGSGQVANSAQMLSQGAVEQASEIEALVSRVEVISNTVQDNAKRCEQAGNITTEVVNKLAESNQHMQDMVNSMNKINQSSDQIGKIIKTIEDIAFQTNILALNAAVEAARAGSAGKGFAVVADEVRNLAAKSAEAAKNTNMLIAASIQSVEEGTSIADQTAASLEETVEAAKGIVDTIQEIIDLSHEQSEEIVQISSGISEISSIVQTNATAAEESTATSEELSGQAETMRALLGKFQIKRSHDIFSN